MLFSKEGARYFTESTRSLTAVVGAADGVDAGPALASMQETLAAAGDNRLQSFYGTWYVDLHNETRDLMGALLRMEITPDEFCEEAQAAADAVAADDSITKLRRPDMPE
jgi:N-acetylglucosamine transport system substrate-binding protein